MLGDFALFLSLPSLRHMAQVPIAPLAADVRTVLQDPPAQPDAQPDAPAVQPVAFQMLFQFVKSDWGELAQILVLVCLQRLGRPRSNFVLVFMERPE